MAQDGKASGLRLIEVALAAGAGVIIALILFAALGAVAGVLWEIVKIAVLVILVIVVLRLVRRHRS
jgi:hypothetical protein